MCVCVHPQERFVVVVVVVVALVFVHGTNLGRKESFRDVFHECRGGSHMTSVFRFTATTKLPGHGVFLSGGDTLSGLHWPLEGIGLALMTVNKKKDEQDRPTDDDDDDDDDDNEEEENDPTIVFPTSSTSTRTSTKATTTSTWKNEKD